MNIFFAKDQGDEDESQQTEGGCPATLKKFLSSAEIRDNFNIGAGPFLLASFHCPTAVNDKYQRMYKQIQLHYPSHLGMTTNTQ